MNKITIQKRRQQVAKRLAPVFAIALAGLLGVAVQTAVPSLPARAASIPKQYLPLFFVPNVGQAAASVQFSARTTDFAALFAPAKILLNPHGANVGLEFAGGNPAPRIEASDPLAGSVHFLLGNDSGKWRTNVPTYGKIVYGEVYSNIDIAFLGDGGRLKSEFVVRPGGEPEKIRCRYSGVRRLRIEETGALVLDTGTGEFREQRPEIYQEIRGSRIHVDGGFRLLDDGQVGFIVGRYNRKQPLIIDPMLSYSTYLGGNGLDTIKGVAVDGGGNVYVTGYTDSLNFPTGGAMQGSNAGGVDVFVAKLNPSGNSLIYCTYLGGGWDDRGFGIAVDTNGSAYVTGWTYSPNFPTTPGARQRVLGGGRDAFVAKLNGSGSALLYSTYIGGASHDSGNAIALDGSGNAYVAGDTYSTNFPALSAYQGSNQGRQDGFALKLRSDGGALIWSTYLGGYGDEQANGIAVDGYGNAYVAGGTTSANFPVFHAYQASLAGGQDAFVTSLGSDGKSLVYSTFLGGSGGTVGANEMATGIAIDAAGNAYLTGITSSVNFPVVNALQPVYGGSTLDAFVTKLDATGSMLVYSTFLGGASVDYASSIAVNSAGIACVSGYTASTNFPTANALQPVNAGGYDVFVAKLPPAGNALDFSTYWGGSDSDAANAAAMDASGNIWIAGQTLSHNFPTKNALQTSNTGGLGGFIAKINAVTPAAVFRTASGSAGLTTYTSYTLQTTGQYITSDAAMSQTAAGDSFVVVRNVDNQIWLNIYRMKTQSWNGWAFAGGPLAGNPAVAATADGGAYVVARDSTYKYWITQYHATLGFRGWVGLGGSFTSEPSVAGAPDGTIYISGRWSNGQIVSGRYLPGTGFKGWVLSTLSPSAAGKPAMTTGSDGAAYVAVKGTNSAIWMARLSGDVWGTWYSGGGALSTGPDLAAAGGTIYAVVTNPAGGVYVQAFREGTGNGWKGWNYAGAYLQSVSISATGGQYFVVGRDSTNNLWWYEAGAGWTCYGLAGWTGGSASAGPR